MTKNQPLRFFLCVILAGCEALTGCASAGKSSRIEKPAVRSFSSQEIQEGQQIHQQILSTFYLYTEPSVKDYVGKVGESLTGSDLGPDKPYEFIILYNDKMYATAAPGGHIYVTTGLINFLDNESELAAVLALEVAALQFNDLKISQTKKTMDGVTQAVSMVGPAFGQIGALAALGIVLLNNAASPGEISKDDRLIKADAMALRYMIHAGYDPQGFLDVLYRFLKADRATLPFFYDYYQSHPITEERFNRLNRDFASLPVANRQLVMRRKEFLEMTHGVREMYAN